MTLGASLQTDLEANEVELKVSEADRGPFIDMLRLMYAPQFREGLTLKEVVDIALMADQVHAHSHVLSLHV